MSKHQDKVYGASQNRFVECAEPYITLPISGLQDLLALIQSFSGISAQGEVNLKIGINNQGASSSQSKNSSRLKELLLEITRIHSDLHHLGENVNFLVTTNLEILQMLQEMGQASIKKLMI